MLLEEGEGEDEEIFQSINKVISRINKNHFLKHFYIILCDQKKKLNEREFLNFKREYIGRPLSITFLIFNKICNGSYQTRRGAGFLWHSCICVEHCCRCLFSTNIQKNNLILIHLKIFNHSLVLNFPHRASIHYVYQVKNRKSLLQECNSYIKEYLERNQLLRTTREFERECSELQLPLPRIISGSSHVYNSWFRTIQNLTGTQFWS